LLGWIIPPRDQPVWVREARVVPLLEWGGDLMLQLVPPADRPRRERTAAPPPPPQPQPLPKATPRPSAPVDTTADSAGETGYKTDERRALENLIRGQPNE
jgi:membrane protein required for colicin V production